MFLNTGNTSNNECLGHEASSSASCTGTAHSFSNVYDVKAAGTISSIWAELSSAPGGTAQWTVRVRKNGLTTAGNTLACTITGTATACEASGSVSIADGDFLSVLVTKTSGNPSDTGFKTYVVIGS
jgi:hypothetical protein